MICVAVKYIKPVCMATLLKIYKLSYEKIDFENE